MPSSWKQKFSALREGRLYRELTMIEVREVLRRYGAGQSQRQIARDTGTGRNTVARYIEVATAPGFCEGEPCRWHKSSVLRYALEWASAVACAS